MSAAQGDVIAAEDNPGLGADPADIFDDLPDTQIPVRHHGLNKYEIERAGSAEEVLKIRAGQSKSAKVPGDLLQTRRRTWRERPAVNVLKFYKQLKDLTMGAQNRPGRRVQPKGGQTMVKGKVKWFNNQKGYGFLLPEGGSDVFVHYSVVEGDGYKTLSPGQDVEFEIINSEKGEQARNVVKIPVA